MREAILTVGQIHAKIGVLYAIDSVETVKGGECLTFLLVRSLALRLVS